MPILHLSARIGPLLGASSRITVAYEVYRGYLIPVLGAKVVVMGKKPHDYLRTTNPRN